jgi:hypothetical protein
MEGILKAVNMVSEQPFIYHCGITYIQLGLCLIQKHTIYKSYIHTEYVSLNLNYRMHVEIVLTSFDQWRRGNTLVKTSPS